MGDPVSGDRVRYRTLVADRRLVAVLLASAIGTVGIHGVPPVLPSVQSAFGVPESRIGLVMSAFFLPAIAAIPVVGVLGDIYGRRRLLLLGTGVFGAAGVAMAWAPGFEALLVLRGVQGLGFAATTPFAITVIGDLHTGPAGSAAQGFRVSAHGVTQIAFPAAAGFLADVAWHRPFLLFALAVPVLVLLWIYLPETKTVDDDHPGIRAALGSYRAAITAEAADRALLVLVAGGFAVFFLKIGVLTYLPLLAVRSLGTSGTVAGLVVSLLGAVRLVSPPLAGAVIERVPRRWSLAGAIGLGVAGAAAMPAAPDVAWLGVAVIVYGVGIALAQPLLNDGVALRAADEHRGGIVSGLNVMKNVANMGAPAVLGLVLAAGGFDAVFRAAAAVAAVYGVTVLALLGSDDA